MSAPPRKRIGSYDVVEPLDEGGMGVVYLAEQPELERLTVIKALRRDLVQNRGLDERFRREAEAASRVQHQNVVAVYDCFVWRGERFIAQEYVDGEDLAGALGAVRRLEPRIAALVALELARGLEAIHECGIVHRDLKPANVLLGRRGEVKIADFGIALEATGERLTQVGCAVGTPPYMSPEQLLGERVDTRSDLFAFGVLLYEMLCGKPPFPEVDPEREEALIRRIQTGRYRPPRRAASRVPRWLARLVRNCLRPRPARRPPSAAAVRHALERGLGRPGPVACRREIAEWLWERKVFEADENETQLARPQESKRSRRPSALAWSLRGAALAAGCAMLAVGAVSVKSGELPALADLRALAASLASEGETARLYLDVKPWARVQIDDGPFFRAPTEQPVRLSAGEHRIALEHPELGRVERTVKLEPGEEHTLKHTFRRR